MGEQTVTALALKGIFPLWQITNTQLEQFDCGKEVLNFWLKKKAKANDLNGGSRTFILLSRCDVVVGFYCLSNYSIEHNGVRAALRRNMPNPIPAVLLGRLAVSAKFQRQGIGRLLLRSAVENFQKVSLLTGAALLLTEPIDEAAKNFYLRFGFTSIGKNQPFLALRPQTQKIATQVAHA